MGTTIVYFSPVFGRVFKQEIFKSIAYGCRVCRGTTDIKSGAGQVVLADLLPAAPVIRPRQTTQMCWMEPGPSSWA